MRSTRPLIPAAAVATLIVSGLAVAAFAKDKGMRAGCDGPDPQHVQRMFERHDADGDGKITAEEMAAAPQRRFAAADADGDGKLSAAEMVEQRAAMMRARIEARVAAMIAEMDDDGDGMLSAEEMGPGRRAERKSEARRAQMHARMDADGDGAVTLEEAQAGAAKMAGRHGDRYGRGEGHGKGHGGMMMHRGEGGHGEGRHDMHRGRGGDCPLADE